MVRRVLEQVRSPLARGQSVLTLECGHLWSWNKPDPPPAEIDCIHCKAGYPPLISARLRHAQARALERLGRIPVLPDDLALLRVGRG